MLVNALRKTNLMIRTLNLPQFLFALLGLAGAQHAQAAVPEAAFVSVMTYNVHGLPWPFASGRDAAFERIEGRLRALRHHNAQPHVVVLQEAFTQGAKAIGTKSGYRYIVNGPSRDSIGNQQAEATDLTFNNAASFFKGETSGKWLDSGLQILSDYPIVSVKRQAFPAFACAGFDCLANKGILLVTIAVPGSATSGRHNTYEFKARIWCKFGAIILCVSTSSGYDQPFPCGEPQSKRPDGICR
jgi:hypothetical protein